MSLTSHHRDNGLRINVQYRMIRHRYSSCNLESVDIRMVFGFCGKPQYCITYPRCTSPPISPITTWSLASSSIVVLLLSGLYFLPLYLVVVYYANFVFVFLFLFKGSSKCGFPPCCPVQVLSFARCCASFVMLSKQIKMMMMMMMITPGFQDHVKDSVRDETHRIAKCSPFDKKCRVEKATIQELAAASGVPPAFCKHLEPCCIFPHSPQVRAACRRNCDAVRCIALRNPYQWKLRVSRFETDQVSEVNKL